MRENIRKKGIGRRILALLLALTIVLSYSGFDAITVRAATETITCGGVKYDKSNPVETRSATAGITVKLLKSTTGSTYAVYITGKATGNVTFGLSSGTENSGSVIDINSWLNGKSTDYSSSVTAIYADFDTNGQTVQLGNVTKKKNNYDNSTSITHNCFIGDVEFGSSISLIVDFKNVRNADSIAIPVHNSLTDSWLEDDDYNTTGFFCLEKATSLSLPDGFAKISTNLKGLFEGYYKLKYVEFGEGFGANATNMSYLFGSNSNSWGCTNLISVNFPDGFGAKAIYVTKMFYNCSGLTSVSFPDGFGKSATYMSNMFEYCANLTSVTFPKEFGAAAESTSQMFNSCTALSSITVQSNIASDISLPSANSTSSSKIGYITNFEWTKKMKGYEDVEGVTKIAKYSDSDASTNYSSTPATFYWQAPIDYTISYKGVDGATWSTSDDTTSTTDSNPNPTTYNVESKSFTLAEPSKNGYEFTGWTLSLNKNTNEKASGADCGAMTGKTLPANSTTPKKSVTVDTGVMYGDATFTANWKIGAPEVAPTISAQAADSVTVDAFAGTLPTGASAYLYYKKNSEDSTAWKEATTTTDTSSGSITATGLTSGTYYDFCWVLSDGTTTSGYGSSASAYTLPAAPTGTTAVTVDYAAETITDSVK